MQNKEVQWEDVYRVHDNGKVWRSLNFHELQTEEFLDFSFLSKNPLKLNRSKLNQIILIMLCRNGSNTPLHQLSSENQYNYVVQAVLRHFTYCNDLISAWGALSVFLVFKGVLILKFSKMRIDDYAKDGGPVTV